MMTPEAIAALVAEVAEDHCAYQDEEFTKPQCSGCIRSSAPCSAARLLEVVEEQGKEIERLLGVKETLNLEAHELSRKLHASEEREKVLRGMVAGLCGDLSDAERAIEGWKFKGGMGSNIASEDRGRFPSIGSRARHEAAREAIARVGTKP